MCVCMCVRAFVRACIHVVYEYVCMHAPVSVRAREPHACTRLLLALLHAHVHVHTSGTGTGGLSSGMSVAISDVASQDRASLMSSTDGTSTMP